MQGVSCQLVIHRVQMPSRYKPHDTGGTDLAIQAQSKILARYKIVSHFSRKLQQKPRLGVEFCTRSCNGVVLVTGEQILHLTIFILYWNDQVQGCPDQRIWLFERQTTNMTYWPTSRPNDLHTAPSTFPTFVVLFVVNFDSCFDGRCATRIMSLRFSLETWACVLVSC